MAAFTWRDGERTIIFGEGLLDRRSAAARRERVRRIRPADAPAAPSPTAPPELGDRAREVHYVARTSVPEAAGAVIEQRQRRPRRLRRRAGRRRRQGESPRSRAGGSPQSRPRSRARRSPPSTRSPPGASPSSGLRPPCARPRRPRVDDRAPGSRAARDRDERARPRRRVALRARRQPGRRDGGAARRRADRAQPRHRSRPPRPRRPRARGGARRLRDRIDGAGHPPRGLSDPGQGAGAARTPRPTRRCCRTR